jgi:hypothetical protein
MLGFLSDVQTQSDRYWLLEVGAVSRFRPEGSGESLDSVGFDRQN